MLAVGFSTRLAHLVRLSLAAVAGATACLGAAALAAAERSPPANPPEPQPTPVPPPPPRPPHPAPQPVQQVPRVPTLPPSGIRLIPEPGPGYVLPTGIRLIPSPGPAVGPDGRAHFTPEVIGGARTPALPGGTFGGGGTNAPPPRGEPFFTVPSLPSLPAIPEQFVQSGSRLGQFGAPFDIDGCPFFYWPGIQPATGTASYVIPPRFAGDRYRLAFYGDEPDPNTAYMLPGPVDPFIAGTAPAAQPAAPPIPADPAEVAAAAMTEGDFDLAARAYRDALAAAPGDARLTRGLAMALLFAGDTSAGTALLSAALAADPTLAAHPLEAAARPVVFTHARDLAARLVPLAHRVKTADAYAAAAVALQMADRPDGVRRMVDLAKAAGLSKAVAEQFEVWLGGGLMCAQARGVPAGRTGRAPVRAGGRCAAAVVASGHDVRGRGNLWPAGIE
ncbi:MAG: tetratricopeptide repeat protein [Phycisphaerales bacterium]